MRRMISKWTFSFGTGQVETKYLTSLMFARATAEKLQEMLMGLQNDQVLSDLSLGKVLQCVQRWTTYQQEIVAFD